MKDEIVARLLEQGHITVQEAVILLKEQSLPTYSPSPVSPYPYPTWPGDQYKIWCTTDTNNNG